jgi:hypothetical protein
VVPSNDDAAIMAAERRHMAAQQRSDRSYRRVIVDVPDTNFRGGEVEVAKYLRGWLVQLPTTK